MTNRTYKIIPAHMSMERVVFGFIIMFCTPGRAQLLINEVMSSNLSSIADEYDVDQQNCPVENCDWWYESMGQSPYDGEYPDWIELYNAGTDAVSLSGYGLSDDPAEPYKWIFSNGKISPGTFLVIFASGKDRLGQYFHTNFKIDRLGETILLTDPSGKLVDYIDTGEIPVDFSLSRKSGGEDWAITHQPTPGKANTTAAFPGFIDSVRASFPAGFYHSAIALSLSAHSSDAEIRYTLDGDEPTLTSRLYTAPIPIRRSTVVRARTFANTIFSSEIMTRTYFINENSTFPVFSISTPPDHLWDEELGIYVPGENADESNRIANYWQDWERPVHIEFFEPDGTSGFQIDAGIKIFGWGSRANALKSLAVMIRDRYGYDELKYPLFPDLDVTNFNSFVLRAAGNDWQKTFFRDPLASGLVKDQNIDRQAFRPAVVFLNGEYWGIHNIREKLNEDYLASHHGVDRDNVDIVSRYWRRPYVVVSEGDDAAYLELENYLKDHEMNEPGVENDLKAAIDVDNFVDYCVVQLFAANYDWPGNNNKCWRPRTPNGRWRWFLYDLDYTFNSNGHNNYRHNTLEHATTEDITGWPNPPHTTFLMRKLLDNHEIGRIFINRCADYLNTLFDADKVEQAIDDKQALYLPEMDLHIDRWGGHLSGMRSRRDWLDNIEVVRDFVSQRAPYMRLFISDYFNLKGWDTLQLDVTPPGSGAVKINSFVVAEYPWEGEYFLGNPIQVTALPQSGYDFIRWEGISNVDVGSQSLTLEFSEALTLTAHFEKTERVTPAVVFNEINYNSSPEFDVEDWVELYNLNANAVDISQWTFQDQDTSNVFIFPANTQIPGDGFAVLCRDAVAFQNKFPGLTQLCGEFNFGLNSEGDQLYLYDDREHLVDSVSISGNDPWPSRPNGNGPTLVLRSPHLDNSLPDNWGVSVGFGSPGAPNELATAVAGQPSSPTLFALGQNYPNPFNAGTTIPYSLPRPADVQLTVYNIRGQTVAILVDEHQSPGEYALNFDKDNLPSGIYFYRLKAGEQIVTKKMTILL